jgi:hypothetical protein
MQLVQPPHLGARGAGVLAHGLEHLRRRHHRLARRVVAVHVAFVKSEGLKPGFLILS